MKNKSYSELLECKGNWIEDFGHENGNYLNSCCLCGDQFLGHKRRVVCKSCTEKKEDVSDEDCAIGHA